MILKILSERNVPLFDLNLPEIATEKSTIL